MMHHQNLVTEIFMLKCYIKIRYTRKSSLSTQISEWSSQQKGSQSLGCLVCRGQLALDLCGSLVAPGPLFSQSHKAVVCAEDVYLALYPRVTSL